MGVHVLVNDVELIGWQNVLITDGMDQIADSFNISTPNEEDPSGLFLPIVPWDPVVIYDDDELMLTGWCDDLNATISPTENRLSAIGRSLAGDLIDCSADFSGGTLRNIDAFKILQKFAAPYNIPVSLASGVDVGDKFDKFKIQVGESNFDAINRALQLRSLLPSSLPDGSVQLIKAASKVATDDLILGINFKMNSSKFATQNRFSEYKILGQKPSPKKKKDSKKNNTANGIAIDSAVPRFRNKVMQSPTRIDSGACQKRAQWEAVYRAGKSNGMSVTISGWRQTDGSPWESNMLVKVTNPVFNIENFEMLIKTRSLADSVSGGKSTILNLVHPDTYTPLPKTEKDARKKNKDAWKDTGTLLASIGTLKPGEIIRKGK